MAKIEVYCHAINCHNSVILDMPEGWLTTLDVAGAKEEGRWIYCPEHKAQMEWFDAVCPGCVGCYPDCGFSRAFAYSYKRTITEADLKVIRSGRCPFRINGTFCVGPDEPFHGIDISDQASTPAGEAVAQAVREYIEKYPVEK